MIGGRGVIVISLLLIAGLACSTSSAQVSSAQQTSEPTKKLSIAGIPDQNVQKLARRFEGLEDYLSSELGVDVEYVPTTNYTATVVAFEQGSIQLAWFGGLTGVQARERVKGSQALAHRPSDAQFHSKFIVASDLDVDSLEDLKGLTFTFGSESSTSGHLMPRYFLKQAGVNPEKDFNGKPNYSGSHTTTWKLVESGSFQAGVLNEVVWDTAVANGEIDLSKVKELSTTPPYFDYNWTSRGDLDQQFGEGFTNKVKQALLDLDDPEILTLFSPEGERFEETNNQNYDAIKQIGEDLGLIR